ncbi:MAG: RNase P subunit p30 family protein [Candidatus Helarchaeota archaeon]
MKVYCDLHVHQRLFQNREGPIKVIQLLEKFKYSRIAIVKEKKSLIPLFEELEKIPTNINFHTRFNIRVESIDALKVLLKKHRKKYDLIAVRSKNKSVLNFAIQDSRIDLLMLEDLLSPFFLSYESAKLLRRHDKPIEIQIRSLITKTGRLRSRILRNLDKSVKNLVRARCPFVVSSNAHDLYELRAPKDMVSLLTLVDFPLENVLKGVSEFPLACLQKVEARKDPNMISNGIEII